MKLSDQVEAATGADRDESDAALVSRLVYMLGPDSDFDNYTFSIRRGTLRRLLTIAALRARGL